MQLLRKVDEFYLLMKCTCTETSCLFSYWLLVSTWPARGSLRKLVHEYSMKDRVGPGLVLALQSFPQQQRQTTVVLDDPRACYLTICGDTTQRRSICSRTC